ncbi:sarcosine oxidase subunit beta [Bartonella apihabitans]|nr:sarcosine oxidase subunit beta [Bartonella apihabitans]
MMSNAAVIRSWTGTEGETSDHQPVIGFSQTTPNLLHAFGFSGAGFQIAPAVGAVISDLIKYNKTEIDVKPFNIGRFII